MDENFFQEGFEMHQWHKDFGSCFFNFFIFFIFYKVFKLLIEIKKFLVFLEIKKQRNDSFNFYFFYFRFWITINLLINWLILAFKFFFNYFYLNSMSSPLLNYKFLSRPAKLKNAEKVFACECGKSYLSFPSLYLHFQKKH